MERILCAANHYDDGHVYDHQPVNIDTGFVIAGRRHHNCIAIFSIMVKHYHPVDKIKLRHNCLQGFLTDTDRFVNRKEALEIALKSGQADENKLSTKSIGLFSEDVW